MSSQLELPTDEVVCPLFCEEASLLPHYATALAAGADLRAALKEPLLLAPGQYALIPTGLKIALPKGLEAQVRPRSGLAFKHGVTVLNAPGTIDADYRGEIGVILINHGASPFLIDPGMRIAQLVVAPVVRLSFERCSQEELLEATQRGEGGFGHTGTS